MIPTPLPSLIPTPLPTLIPTPSPSPLPTPLRPRISELSLASSAGANHDESGHLLHFVGQSLSVSWTDGLLLSNNPLFLFVCTLPGGSGGSDSSLLVPTTRGGKSCRDNDICEDLSGAAVVFPVTGTWVIEPWRDSQPHGTGSKALCLEGFGFHNGYMALVSQ